MTICIVISAYVNNVVNRSGGPLDERHQRVRIGNRILRHYFVEAHRQFLKIISVKNTLLINYMVGLAGGLAAGLG